MREALQVPLYICTSVHGSCILHHLCCYALCITKCVLIVLLPFINIDIAIDVYQVTSIFPVIPHVCSPLTFKIDVGKLKGTYRQLQRLLHPDRFAQKPKVKFELQTFCVQWGMDHGLHIFMGRRAPNNTLYVFIVGITQCKHAGRVWHVWHLFSPSQEEQQYSAEQSALVNRAYSTLLNPYSRGMYLVSIIIAIHTYYVHVPFPHSLSL